jgi:hypothetical protein
MTDDEIIEAKSKEIRRLHNVCKEKDKAIQKAINLLDELQGYSMSIKMREQIFNCSNELKEYLG